MKHLLNISHVINYDSERSVRINGSIDEVYQYIKDNCTAGEVIDIYEHCEQYIYRETVIRFPTRIAKLTHLQEW